MKGKKKYLIIPIIALFLVGNVYAITSNDVIYDNNGTTENLTTTLDNLYSELKKYKTGGSVEANQMLEGATGYSKGVLVTGTIASKGAETITPGTSNKTIESGVYLSGKQTIAGDENLNAANIAAGKTIFGITGSFTSDATATAADIVSGKTAYVNGSKVTGTKSSSLRIVEFTNLVADSNGFINLDVSEKIPEYQSLTIDNFFLLSVQSAACWDYCLLSGGYTSSTGVFRFNWRIAYAKCSIAVVY